MGQLGVTQEWAEPDQLRSGVPKPPPQHAPARSLSMQVRTTEPPGYKARLSCSGGWKCGPVRLCTQSLTCGPSRPFPFSPDNKSPFFCRLRYFNLRKGRAFWGLRRTTKFGSSPRLRLLDAHHPKTHWLEPASSSCAELSYSLLGGFCGVGGVCAAPAGCLWLWREQEACHAHSYLAAWGARGC